MPPGWLTVLGWISVAVAIACAALIRGGIKERM
jgi:hypothetical protein